MKTILKKDLPNENVDNVVWFEHINGGKINLHTALDKKGAAMALMQAKRQADSEMQIELLKREKALKTKDNDYIRDAAFAGIGFRGMSAAKIKLEQKNIIKKRLQIRDLCESKKLEIENAKTIKEISAIKW